MFKEIMAVYGVRQDTMWREIEASTFKIGGTDINP
jgi:hypothetical protein